MILSLGYKKRKNIELFSSFEKEFQISKLQNYIPIYDSFFTLNETNYNTINLNNKRYLHKIKYFNEENNEIMAILKDDIDNITKAEIFIKFAPLLDPFKYITGKYDINNKNLFNLPELINNKNVHSKIMDKNNASYVDNLFYYISGSLLTSHNFINSIEFFGSYLGIKKDFQLNICDDLDYLIDDDFFNNNKDTFFKVQDYSHLIGSIRGDNDSVDLNKKLPTINILHDVEEPNDFFIETLDEELECPILSNQYTDLTTNILSPCLSLASLTSCGSIISDLEQTQLQPLYPKIEIEDVTNFIDEIENENEEKTQSPLQSIKSLNSSNCSSRTSYTRESENENNNNYNEQDNDNESNDEECKTDETLSSQYSDEEDIFVTIPKFPIALICLEKCIDTMDNLILDTNLSLKEWYSMIAQIVFSLLTYQKLFAFTHNDLHTNNIMYCNTKHKNIVYVFNGIHYKVPTFGRIFKIIDFGRSIFTINKTIFCSDSYKINGDAYGQYNTEPFFNEKMKRLDPNYSFDLCRLGCSIYDYVIKDTHEKITEYDKQIKPIIDLVKEWTTDDKGMNILYKASGIERYADFKLYKMIARNVNKHTPENQLKKPFFKEYVVKNLKTIKNDFIVNIDSMITKNSLP